MRPQNSVAISVSALVGELVLLVAVGVRGDGVPAESCSRKTPEPLLSLWWLNVSYFP